MVSLTLSVTEELRHKMDEFPEINWSVVARRAIQNKIELLEKMNKMFAKSGLTEEDAIRLGRKVTKRMTKRLRM